MQQQIHFYVFKKYANMKSTWLLCFYAFITQKSFTRLFPAMKHLAFHACTIEFLSSTFLEMAATSVQFFQSIGPTLTRK